MLKNSRDKIIEYKNLKKYTGNSKNKKVVLVGGCFDIFHYGHLMFLKKAKLAGELLIVALEPDEFITKIKNRKNIHTQDQRAEILSSIELVDLVIKLPLFKTDNEYGKLVKIIKPSIIAVTKGDKQIENKKKQAETVNGKILTVTNLIAGLSTKTIIKDLTSDI